MQDPAHFSTFNRRQALKSFARFAAAISSFTLLDGLSPEAAFAVGQEVHKHLPLKGNPEAVSQGLLLFDPHQDATVIVISEMIIPQSSTPGAKAARVNEFIDVLLASRPKSEQDKFLEGLNWLDTRSQELFGHSFVDCPPEQQKDVLTRISVVNSAEDVTGQDFFELIKVLTVLGYYTSKEGIEQELKFEGWVDYKGCTHPEHRGTERQG
jgi:glucoside 3-dehydrogenase (cytochrome c) hitch-hiker subunit